MATQYFRLALCSLSSIKGVIKLRLGFEIWLKEVILKIREVTPSASRALARREVWNRMRSVVAQRHCPEMSWSEE
jgi:hypothetical protein